MANFSVSNLVKAQARLADKFKNNEMRTMASPAIMLAMQNQTALIPSHEQLRVREDRPITGYMMNRVKRTPGNSRTYNHTGSAGTSSGFDFVWSILSDVFSISLKQMDDNIFSFEEALAQEILNCSINLHEKIEQTLINYLFTQRSQVSVATPKGGTWNATNFAFEVASTDKVTFYQRAKAFMRQNFYRGLLDMIADVNMSIASENLAAQGAGNATNLAYQFAGLTISESTALSDANYANGAVLAMPQGSFSLQQWIPKQNREGRGDYNSVLGGYGSISDPLGTGLQFAVHGYTERADTSALNGNAQDDLLQMEISIDISPVVGKLSNPNESIVFEIAQGL
ncbi:MAG: hypothetical protein EPN37_07195 [Chitinophagaceae bacterium]|nr:MAG: hypothetical protein EPN37_07195 [Chitinophagaceae bacterium]